MTRSNAPNPSKLSEPRQKYMLSGLQRQQMDWFMSRMTMGKKAAAVLPDLGGY